MKRTWIGTDNYVLCSITIVIFITYLSEKQENCMYAHYLERSVCLSLIVACLSSMTTVQLAFSPISFVKHDASPSRLQFIVTTLRIFKAMGCSSTMK